MVVINRSVRVICFAIEVMLESENMKVVTDSTNACKLKARGEFTSKTYDKLL